MIHINNISGLYWNLVYMKYDMNNASPIEYIKAFSVCIISALTTCIIKSNYIVIYPILSPIYTNICK